MHDSPLNVLIVGGGIAGCSAAISLSERGHRVRVIEKQEAWRFQSSGIFVYSNGLQSLGKLGLLPEILNAGYAIPGGVNYYYDNTGQPIVQTVYPTEQKGQIPAILGIKRAELHRVLAGKVSKLGVAVDLGLTVAAMKEQSGQVTVTLSDGTSAGFDLVIGADGVNSATRRMLGFNVAPRHTGFGVWRAVHERPADLTDKVMMMGRGKRFGIMPISQDRLYTFGTVVEPKDEYYPPEEWPLLMQEKFAEFSGPAEVFLAELGEGSEVLYTAVEEVVLPLPWHSGRVVAIGDAAHASTPFMGQGGALAMQDALVLADALELHPSLETALTGFGAVRAPVCKFVQDVSRAVGEAGAAETKDDSDADFAEFRDTAQAKVDDFYTKLAELNAEAEAALKSFGEGSSIG